LLENIDPIVITNADVYDVDVTLFEIAGTPPVVDINFPADGSSVSGDNLLIDGTVYDADFGDYSNEVFVQLYYIDDGDGYTYYYGWDDYTFWGWYTTPYNFATSGTGAGTSADPYIWSADLEPDYLYDFSDPYYVRAFAYDQQGAMGEDTNYFYHIWD
jgi:hypothetical protein